MQGCEISCININKHKHAHIYLPELVNLDQVSLPFDLDGEKVQKLREETAATPEYIDYHSFLKIIVTLFDNLYGE